MLSVMLTYLHHTDPTIPHYRRGQWSFIRGALATVDRPLLGWMGRFFLHNASHDHMAHRKLYLQNQACLYLTSIVFRFVPSCSIL